MGDDTVFYNFIIKNMPAGYKAFSGETNVPTTSVTKVISVDFVDSLSRTTELSLIRNTAELQFISCTFSNIKGSSLNGTICRTNQADDTLVFKGCKFTDIESNAGAVRNTNATSTVLLEGCEFIRCVGNSVGGMLTTGLTEVDNCTFIDNSGSVAEDINFIGGTLTVRNCILQGTGTISGSPTLVTNLTTPPAFIDDTVDNYELVAADAGGTKYWGNSGRPHGANGESFPDSSIDRGANQSTFNANHPYNF